MLQRLKTWISNIISSDTNDDSNVAYSEFESRSYSREISEFRDNSVEYRLFGTGIHVTFGAVGAGFIGLIVTIAFCIIYSFFHSRGMGRNEFIDTLELVDLIFAFCVGVPCHYLLFYGIHIGNKRFLSPFLIFYCTNFALNTLFTVITFAAALLDVHRHLLGRVQYDFGWTAFQVGFTLSQGFAIYLVIRCRKYLDAKERWHNRNKQQEEVYNSAPTTYQGGDSDMESGGGFPQTNTIDNRSNPSSFVKSYKYITKKNKLFSVKYQQNLYSTVDGR